VAENKIQCVPPGWGYGVAALRLGPSTANPQRRNVERFGLAAVHVAGRTRPAPPAAC